MIAVECEPLPLEVVVRSYLTGVTSTSIWTAYARGERTFCGHALPEGLRKNEKLPAPIVTPSTKAEHGGHDQSVSGQELIASGVISREDFGVVHDLALSLFSAGVAHCAKQGIILVDTKYEPLLQAASNAPRVALPMPRRIERMRVSRALWSMAVWTGFGRRGFISSRDHRSDRAESECVRARLLRNFYDERRSKRSGWPGGDGLR